MASIPLNHGKYALIDDEDYDLIAAHKWWYNTNGYAYTTKRVDGKNKNTMMHHFIMPREGLTIDHISGNTLDNRRSNLRYLTHAGNLRNNDAKGVCFTKRDGTWFAYVNSGKNRKTLGFGYKTFAEAKEVRDDYIKTIIK